MQHSTTAGIAQHMTVVRFDGTLVCRRTNIFLIDIAALTNVGMDLKVPMVATAEKKKITRVKITLGPSKMLLLIRKMVIFHRA